MRKPQLFMLHFAGGNCYSYVRMSAYLHDFEVIPLELPGRGRRMKESLLFDFDLAAQDLFEKISAKLTTPHFAIYGHSMGAYLGLRVTNLLERAGKMPGCLMVSGNPGPGIPRKQIKHLLPHDDFVAAIRQMGGVSNEFFENEELLNFFTPIIRADFAVVEKNDIADEPPVNAPLCVWMGSDEDGVDEINNWSRFTRSDFKYDTLPGHHFFIYDHPEAMATAIQDFYRHCTEKKVAADAIAAS